MWIEFAVNCEYLDRDEAAVLYRAYDGIIATIVSMIARPDRWLLERHD